jgi:beta-lactamase superfamily II metal-dependent hydrolase
MGLESDFDLLAAAVHGFVARRAAAGTVSVPYPVADCDSDQSIDLADRVRRNVERLLHARCRLDHSSDRHYVRHDLQLLVGLVGADGPLGRVGPRWPRVARRACLVVGGRVLSWLARRDDLGTRHHAAALAVGHIGCMDIVGLVPFTTRSWTRDGFDCTVVAVGHGECVLLQAPSGETLLYDAGGIGSPEYATQSIAAVLWDRGIMHIDGIVLSHSDTDHYNAVPGLLERFGVGTVYVSTVMFRSKDDTLDRGPKVLLDAIYRAGVPIREIWSGDRLHVGPDVTVQVLHPPRKGVLGSDNANSVTLGVEYAGRRILLPGDLESPGIDDVMAEAPYDCDVLLAPHHGSRRSDPPGFSAWSKPEWVVLSGGGGELAAPVIRTYEEAGARVLVTNEVGAVQFKVRPDSSLQMTSFRPITGRLPTVAANP